MYKTGISGRPPLQPGTGGEFGTGGKVVGKGSGDKVPALLEPGEFVVKKDAVKRVGVEKLKEINRG